MRLYIVRHAFAGQHGDPAYPNDDLRPLTNKGRRQFRRLVKHLSPSRFAPRAIATSPLVRCRQTADIVADHLAEVPIVELDALRPGSRLKALVDWSNSQELESLAWVGHAPDVDLLAAALLGMNASAADDDSEDASGGLRFAKGAIAAIDFGGSITIGTLRWFVTPKLYS